jgi:hypothetical protein
VEDDDGRSEPEDRGRAAGSGPLLRTDGAALAGFSPLLAAYLLGILDGRPWLVAGYMVLVSLVGLVAFLASREGREIDIEALDRTRSVR